MRWETVPVVSRTSLYGDESAHEDFESGRWAIERAADRR